MDQARKDIEVKILEKYFPKRFVFVHPKDGTTSYLDVGVQTNSKKAYRLKIMLEDDFPSSVPAVYVTSPNPLRDYDGKKLHKTSVSVSMHLLTPDDDNNVRICHYISANWTPNVTLYQVILKCRFWLEAYEGHLRTGQPLDYFLSHTKK